jgi:hypothetical protein
MARSLARLAVVGTLALFVSGCVLHRPDISELQHEPWRYQDKTVQIDGVVTSSWGLPVMPVRFYRVSDGTGEVTVLSRGFRTPSRGARVRVKGTIEELAVFGGAPIGLHLREQDLDIRRR